MVRLVGSLLFLCSSIACAQDPDEEVSSLLSIRQVGKKSSQPSYGGRPPSGVGGYGDGAPASDDGYGATVGGGYSPPEGGPEGGYGPPSGGYDGGSPPSTGYSPPSGGGYRPPSDGYDGGSPPSTGYSPPSGSGNGPPSGGYGGGSPPELPDLADFTVGSFVTSDTTDPKRDDHGDWVKRYTFAKPMSAVPVVVGLMTGEGPHPAQIRFFDVDEKGFSAAVLESPTPKDKNEGQIGGDGPHLPETVTYIAAVPGVTQVGGMTVEAGLHDTDSTQEQGITGEWDRIGFKADFDSRPVFLSGLQTSNNNKKQLSRKKPKAISPWLTSVVDNVNSNRAKVALERSEVTDGSSVEHRETIGFIAISKGSGEVAGVQYSVKQVKLGKKDDTSGWDDDQVNGGELDIKPLKFGMSMDDALVVASKTTRNGNNGGWLRSVDQKANSVKILVDEDTWRDEERHHIAEDVSMAVFERAFSYP